MNQNSSFNRVDGVNHSKPIPIATQRFRHRSTSVSSDSSGSPTSPLQTPQNTSPSGVPKASPPSSPILYFLSQSPAKSPATFPFRGFAPPPVFEGRSGSYKSTQLYLCPAIADEVMDDHPVTSHARRASTAGRFGAQPTTPESQQERGVNLLRRLSLGSALAKPPTRDTSSAQSPPQPVPPPNSTATPASPITTAVDDTARRERKARRSATIAEPTRQRRAPSPMGERILKGHFDGFN
ncbi:hypothetical protein F5I97DRAFT_1937904 [Phlebopus sp. FC_14]|nr:hypothetical protein F5I97DRAFT_1937904 [Phlebopus sp. FC_14]